MKDPDPAEDLFDPLRLYEILYAHYGPSGWWPGETPFEIAVGAILTQNTAWTNVEKAIINLRVKDALTPDVLCRLDMDELALLLKPSGYYNIKARRLKNLIEKVLDTDSGGFDAFLSQDLNDLRHSLLDVNGIGKETADSICCYAAGKTVFVIDAYTRRVLTRHGYIDSIADYDSMQALFHSRLPNDLQIYKDLHAYFVFVGKDYCRSRNPRCDTCPLKGWGRLSIQ